MTDASKAVININTSGDNTIIAAPGAGLKIKIISLVFICAAAVTVTFKSSSTAITGAMSYAANGGLGYSAEKFPLVLTANEEFVINLGGNVQVSGFVEYITGS